MSSDDLPKVYVLTGHGESQLPDSFAQSMESDNLEVEELSLLSLEQVPEDADCLVINAPQSDLSQEEAQMLISYLDEGGRVMLFTDYIASGTMENLLSVTAHMGLTVGQGLIVEGDGSMSLRGYAYYLLPGLNSHDITQPLIDGGYYALVPLAQPMEETGESEAQGHLPDDHLGSGLRQGRGIRHGDHPAGGRRPVRSLLRGRSQPIGPGAAGVVYLCGPAGRQPEQPGLRRKP